MLDHSRTALDLEHECLLQCGLLAPIEVLIDPRILDGLKTFLLNQVCDGG